MLLNFGGVPFLGKKSGVRWSEILRCEAECGGPKTCFYRVLNSQRCSYVGWIICQNQRWLIEESNPPKKNDGNLFKVAASESSKSLIPQKLSYSAHHAYLTQNLVRKCSISSQPKKKTAAPPLVFASSPQPCFFRWPKSTKKNPHVQTTPETETPRIQDQGAGPPKSIKSTARLSDCSSGICRDPTAEKGFQEGYFESLCLARIGLCYEWKIFKTTTVWCFSQS